MQLFDSVFLEFVGLLNKHGVRYLLVGGHAVNLYGYSRTTADLDIWVEPTNTNALKLAAAIDELGFDGSALAEIDFTQPQVFDLGSPPELIEIMNHISGVKFSAAFPNRQLFTIQGMDLPVISLSDLRKNKTASGRYRDLDDLEHLA